MKRGLAIFFLGLGAVFGWGSLHAETFDATKDRLFARLANQAIPYQRKLKNALAKNRALRNKIAQYYAEIKVVNQNIREYDKVQYAIAVDKINRAYLEHHKQWFQLAKIDENLYFQGAEKEIQQWAVLNQKNIAVKDYGFLNVGWTEQPVSQTLPAAPDAAAPAPAKVAYLIANQAQRGRGEINFDLKDGGMIIQSTARKPAKFDNMGQIVGDVFVVNDTLGAINLLADNATAFSNLTVFASSGAAAADSKIKVEYLAAGVPTCVESYDLASAFSVVVGLSVPVVNRRFASGCHIQNPAVGSTISVVVTGSVGAWAVKDGVVDGYLAATLSGVRVKPQP